MPLLHLQKSRTMLDGDRRKRLTIDLTSREHRVLKRHAAQAGMTMRDLVLRTLRREGLLGRSKSRRPVRAR